MNRTSKRILVIDDNAVFAETLTCALREEGFKADATAVPADLFKAEEWRERRYDLVLLDMRLGARGSRAWSAPELLPYLRTYMPKARIAVFSQGGVSPTELTRCVRLGAVGVVPNALGVSDMVMVADVYAFERERSEHAREELIGVLLENISSNRDQGGRYLEMLVVNLFRSIPAFDVVGANVASAAGEIDVLVEITNRLPFWEGMHSPLLVVECKAERSGPGPAEFSCLRDRVRAQGLRCRVGLIVSLKRPTTGFRRMQQELRAGGEMVVFGLYRDHLDSLIELSADRRAAYLEEVFAVQ